MDSKIGLIIQLNGVILITVLSLCLRRSLKLQSLKYWTMAWLCLSFALICLRLAFSYDEYSAFLFTYFFLGEYIFGFMLIAGCQSLPANESAKPRSELFIIPFVLVALALPQVITDFDDAFAIHALIQASLYATALVFIRRARQATFGWHVMHVSLIFLALDFLLYSIVYYARTFTGLSTDFLVYNSVADLVLQTALGFGMVITLLEQVLREVEDTNTELRSTQKQLEALVHTDPLTAAFNRHAFYGFMRKQGESEGDSTGCVGFFDIDDLKAINDCFGHTAGDMVIRTVVRAIRELIRAEDLIYRWGGDEFFVIMVSMDAQMAEDRMARLDSILRDVYVDHIPEPISIGVSWGFMDYADPDDLEAAIKSADSMMYRRKQLRKMAKPTTVEIVPPPSDNPAIDFAS
ncbi:MAG TPA: GGDEF domain-containing protein [Pyrinomonadaceae bacterium]|nr:GGDEF domain-containing protein [Pyrinomonadaceae bacterium]